MKLSGRAPAGRGDRRGVIQWQISGPRRRAKSSAGARRRDGRNGSGSSGGSALSVSSLGARSHATKQHGPSLARAGSRVESVLGNRGRNGDQKSTLPCRMYPWLAGTWTRRISIKNTRLGLSIRKQRITYGEGGVADLSAIRRNLNLHRRATFILEHNRLTGGRSGFIPPGRCVWRIGGEIGGHLQGEAPSSVAVCFGERGR
jgi:hypothetical protein